MMQTKSGMLDVDYVLEITIKALFSDVKFNLLKEVLKKERPASLSEEALKDITCRSIRFRRDAPAFEPEEFTGFFPINWEMWMGRMQKQIVDFRDIDAKISQLDHDFEVKKGCTMVVSLFMKKQTIKTR